MKFALPLFLSAAAMANMVSAQELDIPGTAVAAGVFETLVAALGAADLVGALSEPNGPFTVFAPVDNAFAALPEGLVDCLLIPDNVDVLSEILTYHVLEGSVLSTMLEDEMEAETLQGDDIIVDLTDGVKINTATVVTADVNTTNGVIHIIDSVLVPPELDVVGFLGECTATEPPTEAETEAATEPEVPEPTEDIPATAITAGTFQTLVAALSAADLVAPLSSPNGPFTVFAPADSAFASLPEGLVDCLIKPENQAVLSGILTYHVVEGQVLSTDLSDGMSAGTLNGADVTVDLTDGVKVGGSTVVAPDVLATNGVIHVIDNVLVPPGVDVAGFLASCIGMEEETPEVMEPTMDIPSTAVAAGTFETLVAALSAAELVSALGEPNGPYTVFAPTDDAFAGLPEGLVGCLVKPENKEVLTGILTYHVVSGKVMSTDLEDSMMAATLNGADITFDLTMGVKVNAANVIQPDIETTNGVIHVIDSVLVPTDVDVSGFLGSCMDMDMDMEEAAPTMAPVMADDVADGAMSLGKSLVVAAISTLVAFAM